MRIWTPSWVPFGGGLVMLMLSAFHVAIEMLGLRKLAMPLAIVGMNSIFVYLGYQLSSGWIKATLQVHLGAQIFGGEFGPMVEHRLRVGSALAALLVAVSPPCLPQHLIPSALASTAPQCSMRTPHRPPAAPLHMPARDLCRVKALRGLLVGRLRLQGDGLLQNRALEVGQIHLHRPRDRLRRRGGGGEAAHRARHAVGVRHVGFDIEYRRAIDHIDTADMQAQHLGFHTLQLHHGQAQAVRAKG